MDPALLWWPLPMVAGALLGRAYFTHLRRTATLYLHGTSPLRAVTETIARVAAVLLSFCLLTRWSASAAIVGLVGFSIARQRVLARAEYD
jgi:hypothetical protein